MRRVSIDVILSMAAALTRIKRSWLANADGPSGSQSRCEYFPGKRQEMALTCDGKFNGAITYELVCTGNMCSDLTMDGGLLDSTAAIAKGTFQRVHGGPFTDPGHDRRPCP